MASITALFSTLFGDNMPEHVYADMKVLVHNFTSLYLSNIAIQNILLLMILSSTLLGTLSIVHSLRAFQRSSKVEGVGRRLSQSGMVNNFHDESGSNSDEDVETSLYSMDHMKGNFMAKSCT